MTPSCSELTRMKACLGRVGQRANRPASFSPYQPFGQPHVGALSIQQMRPSQVGTWLVSGVCRSTAHTTPQSFCLEYHMQSLSPKSPAPAFLALSGLLRGTVDRGLLGAPAMATGIHKGCWKSRGTRGTLLGTCSYTNMQMHTAHPVGDILVEVGRYWKGQKQELRDIYADVTALSLTGGQVCVHWAPLGMLRSYGVERIAIQEPGCGAKCPQY